MALASSVALLVVLMASAVGWSTSRRLTVAPSFGLVRRRARTCLVAGAMAVAAGLVHVGSAVVAAAGVPGWADLARSLIVGVPLLAIWSITIPRTWMVSRRLRATDPLHWPGGRLRHELAAPELVIPFAAAVVAAMVVALMPASVAAAALQLWFAALGVAAATVLLAVRQRRRQGRVAEPPYAEMRWAPTAERVGASR